MKMDGFIQKCDEMLIAQEGVFDENNKITLTVSGGNNITQLIKMLAWIEYCGDIGHSTNFTVGVDGDGGCRFRFDFQDKNMRKEYKSIKEEVSADYRDHSKDIESFIFE